MAVAAEQPMALIVDDDPDVRELVRFALAQAGFKTEVAEDGETALSLAQDLKPDVMVLDVMLPGQSGIEICQLLGSRPELAPIPVVLLTARAQDEDVERGFDAGAVDYVVKPFSPRALVRRVEAVVARSR
jgi:DNA-binding response OmpR family regulator